MNDQHLEQCDVIGDQLLAAIKNPEELHKRLRRMGAEEYFRWIHDHMDEVPLIISSPPERYRDIPAQRRDLLLYAGAFLCNMARGLIEVLHKMQLPLPAPSPQQVASMGMHAWHIGRNKAAPWRWEGRHPFVRD